MTKRKKVCAVSGRGTLVDPYTFEGATKAFRIRMLAKANEAEGNSIFFRDPKLSSDVLRLELDIFDQTKELCVGTPHIRNPMELEIFQSFNARRYFLYHGDLYNILGI